MFVCACVIYMRVYMWEYRSIRHEVCMEGRGETEVSYRFLPSILFARGSLLFITVCTRPARPWAFRGSAVSASHLAGIQITLGLHLCVRTHTHIWTHTLTGNSSHHYSARNEITDPNQHTQKALSKTVEGTLFESHHHHRLIVFCHLQGRWLH